MTSGTGSQPSGDGGTRPPPEARAVATGAWRRRTSEPAPHDQVFHRVASATGAAGADTRPGAFLTVTWNRYASAARSEHHRHRRRAVDRRHEGHGHVGRTGGAVATAFGGDALARIGGRFLRLAAQAG